MLTKLTGLLIYLLGSPMIKPTEITLLKKGLNSAVNLAHIPVSKRLYIAEVKSATKQLDAEQADPV